MATWLVVLLVSVLAVGLMALGLSLTLMIKGHHIDGEISTNKNMRALGITCAVHDAVGAAHNSVNSDKDYDCASSCASCADLCASDMK